MGKVINTEIRDNYTTYNVLVQDRKTMYDPIISISDIKRSNHNFYSSSISNLKHNTFVDPVAFIVEVRVNNHKSFKFQLKSIGLSKTPFFRFDSDGTSHRNYDDDSIPLSEQNIQTPHFNYFDKNGLLLAYQTEVLKKESTKKILEDIDLCVAHFCMEANVRLNEDDFPTILIQPSMLSFTMDNLDPNRGIIFS